MSREDLNKKITKQILEDTNAITDLKDQTWQKIDQELFPSKNKRFKKRMIPSLGAAAIICFLVFGFSEPGQAMMQKLKDLFVEEKQQLVEIEGHSELRDVHLKANEELRYVMYVDEEYYQLVKEDTKDQIIPLQELDDRYPEVAMVIERRDNTTVKETVQELKQELTAIGLTINQEDQVSEPLESYLIKGIGPKYTNEHGKTGHQWDTPIHRYYVTEAEEGQLYVIKQKYFLEAAEGHGVRMDAMLESFQIVKE